MQFGYFLCILLFCATFSAELTSTRPQNSSAHNYSTVSSICQLDAAHKRKPQKPKNFFSQLLWAPCGVVAYNRYETKQQHDLSEEKLRETKMNKSWVTITFRTGYYVIFLDSLVISTGVRAYNSVYAFAFAFLVSPNHEVALRNISGDVLNVFLYVNFCSSVTNVDCQKQG